MPRFRRHVACFHCWFLLGCEIKRTWRNFRKTITVLKVLFYGQYYLSFEPEKQANEVTKTIYEVLNLVKIEITVN